MRETSKTIYKFDELSDEAKERARDWYREGALDYDWYDSIYDDASQIFEILGIDSRKLVTLMNGSTRCEPCIWFSGFASQGDGACFEGSYAYAKGSKAKIRAYCNDAELYRIADGLADVQRRSFYRLEATVKHRGHYYHEMGAEVDVFDRDENYRDIGDAADTVAELLRDLMRWIYRTLEAEHDYLLSDEAVDETILSNEYEFDEEGNRE